MLNFVVCNTLLKHDLQEMTETFQNTVPQIAQISKYRVEGCCFSFTEVSLF